MNSFPEQPEIVPDAELAALRELGQNIAKINDQVNRMTGVRRGIVVREAERELKRLEHERYKD
jgi:hypothetical protein